MSDKQSNLSGTGFDYVVAVTQDSINGALEQYLYGGLPEVTLCYAYDNSVPPNPVPIDFATLVANAGGTDPFAVPDGTPGRDQRVQNLNDAGFAFAVRAKLGLPPGVAPADLPPIVALKPGQSNVTYTLMFSEFIATEIVYGPRNSMTWVNQAQPNGTSWTFSGAVDLNFQEQSFESLPAAVRDRLKDLGDPNMFSVKQLYYDLNSSNLIQGFQFNQVPSNSLLNGFMTDDFVNTYFKNLKGAEVLGYSAAQVTNVQPASLAVTDVNFFTPDAVGAAGAPLTLNYLCATSGHALPDTTHAGFGWNWIDSGEASQYDGVAALDRNTLARYLNSARLPDGRTLEGYVASNCFHPSVRVYVDGTNVDYQFGATAGQAPTVTYPDSGATILHYSYGPDSSFDQAGLNGALGKMELRCSFDLTVTVAANTMVVVQHLVMYTNVSVLATSDDGNVVDKQITDTYTIGVDDKGQLIAALKSSDLADNSQHPSANGFLNFFADVQTLSNAVEGWARTISGKNLTDVPVSLVGNFVFPGGSTFSFTDAAFSDNQDLVSHITYADPS